MLRGLLVVTLYGVGAFLSLQAVAYACSFWIWSEIFRPITFSRRIVDLPEVQIVTAMLAISILIRKWQRRWNPAASAMVFVILWIGLSTTFAHHHSVAMKAATMYAKYMIPLLVISISLTTRFAQNLFVWTLAASVGIYGAQAGFYCFMSGSPHIYMSIDGGQMTDRNDFIVGVIASLPLIAYVASTYAWHYQRVVRIAAKFAFVMSILAIFFSLSRGGVVGIACLFLYWVVATGRFGKRVLIAGVVLCVAIPFMPVFVTERMQTIELDTGFQSDGSAHSRLMLAKTALAVTRDNPIVGVGPQNFIYVAAIYGSPSISEPHNIWLKASAEYGLPMLIVFVLLILFLLRRMARERVAARKRGDRETERLSIALSCSIIGFLAPASFTSQFLSEYLWAVLAVSGAFVAHCAHMRSQGEFTVPADDEESVATEPAAAPVV